MPSTFPDFRVFSYALLQPFILLRINLGLGVNFEKNDLGSVFVRKRTMPNASTYVQVVDKSSGKYKVVKRFGTFKNESSTWAQGR